jgi:hypothetical protein
MKAIEQKTSWTVMVFAALVVAAISLAVLITANSKMVRAESQGPDPVDPDPDPQTTESWISCCHANSCTMPATCDNDADVDHFGNSGYLSCWNYKYDCWGSGGTIAGAVE